MNYLAFKPKYGCIMIQYRNHQKFQEYKLSIHEIMDRDSKDTFSRHIFEILTLLGVDEENISLVGQTIGEMTKWPNHIWLSGKAGEILTALSNRFPASDAHTDEAMMARQGIHSIRHDTRNEYIPLDRGRDIK